MTAIHRQVEAARNGELPRVIAKMKSGWAVLGDPQITYGHCLLLPDPVVPDHRGALDTRAQPGSAIVVKMS